MLIAPFTWPFANAFGPRTSTTIKSGLADFRDSCTSQQSVSNASISWKCLTASSDGAAAVSVTCVVMVAPSAKSAWRAGVSAERASMLPSRHAETRDLPSRQYLRAGRAAQNARLEARRCDRAQHAQGGPADPDPGARGRSALRAGRGPAPALGRQSAWGGP